jgi:hypothetical protein
MKRIFGPLILVFLAGNICAMGTFLPVSKHPRDSLLHISVGGALAFSTVNMGIEPIGEIKTGLNGRLSIRFRRRLGITGEFTDQLHHDALPAWGGIEARNYDLNLNYLYLNVGQSNTHFYGIVGACLQQWKGTYQGVPVFTKDIYDYQQGEVVNFNWTALNLGIGFERFYHHLALFGEFKFRFGQNYPDEPFGIVDVCFTVGTKINLLSIGNQAKQAGAKHNRAHSFKLQPKIYHWF